MNKYNVKRVVVSGSIWKSDAVGWQYNPHRNLWEMYDTGKVKPCYAITTKTLVESFINYNWENK